MPKGPLGNDCFQTQRHPLGELAQLKPNADSPDVSWEAYWLPMNQPGRPHIVEIEYPSDVPQTLGVSILEPTAAGGLAPLVVNSSMANAAERSAWPRSRDGSGTASSSGRAPTTPLLLISNGRERTPAVYGKIRVLAAGQRLPRALPDRAGANRRLLAAYLERPLIPENFAADECLDSWSGRSLDDWTTFYEGGTRLVEYLNHTGCNGLMLGVLADGSTIYPSALLQPTPRYDTGAFFATAQDPVRKDVLEMLLRLFDREDLQLIPMVEFAAPLPELEALRRGGDRSADGIEWIGAEGTASVQLVAAATRIGAVLQRARSARATGDARRAAGVDFPLRAASVADGRGRAAVGRRLCATARAAIGDSTTRRSPDSSTTRNCKCRAMGRSDSPSERRSSARSRNAARGWNGGRRNWPSSTAAPTTSWPRFGPAAACIWPAPA